MALYRTRGVKTGFTFALQFFMFISDSLGGVNELVSYWHSSACHHKISLVFFISYMIFSSLVKSLARIFSQFICNLHLFAFGFNCQVVRLKPRDTIKNATLLAAKCGQYYLLIFYVFKICALCNRCLRTPNFWLEIMVIIEFVSHPCNYKIFDWFWFVWRCIFF